MTSIATSPVATGINGGPAKEDQGSIDLTGDDSSGDESRALPSITARSNGVGHTARSPTTIINGNSHGPSSSSSKYSTSLSPSASTSSPRQQHSQAPYPQHLLPRPNLNGVVYTGSNIASPSSSSIAGPSHLGFGQYNPHSASSSSSRPQQQPVMGWSPNQNNPGYPTSTATPDISRDVYRQQVNIAAGIDPSSAIDLTNIRIPSPPPPPPNDKHPICIGSLLSSALMLYPCPAVVIGAQPPPGSRERFDVVDYKGAELLRVKLKYRPAGTLARKDDPTSILTRDTVQVLTPSLTMYVGDLDSKVADPLADLMGRGLIRLEGFVQRLHPDAPQFQVRVNVLLFTLPSNVQYIANYLAGLSLYLLDPIPPYNPALHSDNPVYVNAHGGGHIAMQMHIMAQRRAIGATEYGAGGMVFGAREDKTTQVEVQRKQVDEVFKSLDSGGEIEQSDPGPLIKTDLFPHQRKALTFLLEREQDSSSLKQAKKNAKKALKKSKRAPSVETVSADGESVKGKEKEKDKDDNGRSLWEKIRDENGKVRSWKNKVTGEETRAKKGEKPDDCKGAILADDMGLGKTLSVVSLIASTRGAAHDFAKAKVEKVDTPASNGPEPDLKTAEFKTKVFGMPDIDEMLNAKGKKRKHEEEMNQAISARRSRITTRSKGTLLVCPMSTITNWEDQIKEHWNGPVEIIGGASGVMPPKKIERKWKPPKADGAESSDDEDLSNFDLLRVYIYHGPSRRPDPQYISEFDIVITSYNTLANEYSKQSGACDTEVSTPGETAYNSGEEGIEVSGDTSLNPRATKPEVEAEIKATEVAALMRGGMKKGKGRQRGALADMTSPLQAIEWFRVVLDEAHYIKTPGTVASQAACAVEADRRVALSGTPIQNKIEDVWALFKFLRLSPVDDKDVFTQYISSPCKYGEQIGVARLQLVMRCCTLRRTKDSTTEDGKRILNLPPRKEVQLWLELRDDERKVYDARASVAKEKVGELKAKNELGKNYANMLQEVLRLRQICNHVDLAMLGPVEEDYDGTVMDYEVAAQGIERNGLNQARAVAVVCFLKEGDGASCAGCGYDYGDHFPWIGLGGVEETKEEKPKTKKLTHKPILTKCLHLYCPACFKSNVYSDYSKRLKSTVARSCGCCNSMLRLPADIIEVVPPDSADAAEATAVADQPKRAARKKYVRPPGEKPNLSTKMQYLHDELLKLSKRNPNSPNYDPFINEEDGLEELDADGQPIVTKSVVFSQWTTMLDRIADMLDEANIRYSRLDGTMSREDRAKAIDALKFKKQVEVLLVSTRAGGVGLNLTVASRCYLVDPYWNPSVESQAIDRIHRMGQTRPVLAIKLMIKDSIEEKLDKIQKKKANLAQLSLKNMTRKELLAQKSEELASLFS
ncbi:hypothetical protein CI109_106075 [Kwoniella shandongensis]|uniref:Uncharacterized protein n=1 Tax=Kwoniella shandongensis TaxID=1734106 RepID=A0A5M6BQY7_9TREE|nr:uncharacterized protein CI109_006387 [Kwoniella shandongensis]KAA5525316.1 hypothetical protein CI109_006387 [Kwoniella shandongensis]